LRSLIERIMRRDGDRSADVIEDFADVLASRDERGNAMDFAHKTMVIAAARFNEKLRAGDVMTPRADIIALDSSSTLGEAARLFTESQHSRLPIYRETLDDPVGFVHVKDVLSLLSPDETGAPKAKFADRPLMRLKRDTLFVPPSMPLPTLLVKMKSQRVHLALVIDEYGGTDGLISIEDIVEQIVGEIDDEYDIADSERCVVRAGNIIDADGRVSVEYVAAQLKADLKLPDNENEIETIAGLAAALATRVPERGEVLRHPAGFDIEVLDADPRRAKRLRIRPALEIAREEAAE
jgi:CBS domain containing-hemolysin-like protein